MRQKLECDGNSFDGSTGRGPTLTRKVDDSVESKFSAAVLGDVILFCLSGV